MDLSASKNDPITSSIDSETFDSWTVITKPKLPDANESDNKQPSVPKDEVKVETINVKEIIESTSTEKANVDEKDPSPSKQSKESDVHQYQSKDGHSIVEVLPSEHIKDKNINITELIDDLSDGISIISEGESTGRHSPNPHYSSVEEYNTDSEANNREHHHRTFQDVSIETVGSAGQSTIAENLSDRNSDENSNVLIVSQQQQLNQNEFSNVIEQIREIEIFTTRSPVRWVLYLSVFVAILAFIGKIIHPEWVSMSSLREITPLREKIENLELENNLLRAEIDLLNKQVKYLSNPHGGGAPPSGGYHKDNKWENNNNKKEYKKSSEYYNERKRDPKLRVWPGGEHEDLSKPIEISKSDLYTPADLDKLSQKKRLDLVFNQLSEKNLMEAFNLLKENIVDAVGGNSILENMDLSQLIEAVKTNLIGSIDVSFLEGVDVPQMADIIKDSLSFDSENIDGIKDDGNRLRELANKIKSNIMKKFTAKEENIANVQNEPTNNNENEKDTTENLPPAEGQQQQQREGKRIIKEEVYVYEQHNANYIRGDHQHFAVDKIYKNFEKHQDQNLEEPRNGDMDGKHDRKFTKNDNNGKQQDFKNKEYQKHNHKHDDSREYQKKKYNENDLKNEKDKRKNHHYQRYDNNDDDSNENFSSERRGSVAHKKDKYKGENNNNNNGKYNPHNKQHLSDNDDDWHHKMMKHREDARKKHHKENANNWYIERASSREESRNFETRR